jgi:hypothetical protein
MIKNITLSADEKLIEQARKLARAENTTLNVWFREWLQQCVNSKMEATDFDRLMQSLSYAKSERAYSREEMNER